MAAMAGCVPPDQRQRRVLSATTRAAVAERYHLVPNGRWTPAECYWCGAAGKAAWTKRETQRVGWVALWGLEWDHVIPLSRGGADTHENVVWACVPCNRGRCHRLADEWTPEIGKGAA